MFRFCSSFVSSLFYCVCAVTFYTSVHVHATIPERTRWARRCSFQYKSSGATCASVLSRRRRIYTAARRWQNVHGAVVLLGPTQCRSAANVPPIRAGSTSVSFASCLTTARVSVGPWRHLLPHLRTATLVAGKAAVSWEDSEQRIELPVFQEIWWLKVAEFNDGPGRLRGKVTAFVL